MENPTPAVSSFVIDLNAIAHQFAARFETAASPIIRDILSQIGPHTVLAISGGRWTEIDPYTVHLPIDKRWKVEVKYDRAADAYTVSRLRRYKNTDQWRVAGQMTHVYFDVVSQVADEASLFISVPNFGR